VRIPVCEVVAARPHLHVDVQGAGGLFVGTMERILRAAVQPPLRAACLVPDPVILAAFAYRLDLNATAGGQP